MRASELQKELRIGNYLLGKCVDELDERKEWWEQYQIKDAEDLMGVKDGWDERIPLTEEWLLKFGFNESNLDEDNKWLKLKYRFLNFVSDESVNFEKVYLTINKMDVTCDYVHQLQNLYFALCGEELELKSI